MRHVIGFLNKPTRDGRTIAQLTFRDQCPITDTDYTRIGWAAAFRIDDGTISCFTSMHIAPCEVLSLNVQGTLAFHDGHDITQISGGLVTLTLINRSDWAWYE